MDNLSKNKQQQYGQFFTEKELTEFTINKTKEFINLKGNVLEPSHGDGAFINLLKLEENIHIDGYEIDEEYILPNEDNVTTFNKDFLLTEIDKKYNVIIGNPPYIELTYSFYDKSTKELLKKQYKNICKGRINLCHMFIKRSMDLLEDGGVISFLLPSAILTSPYYNILRKEIYDNYTIEYVLEDSKFKGVAVNVSLLIIKKKKSSNKQYFVNYGDSYYITENYSLFPTEVSTLRDNNFKISIGNIEWNKYTESLTDNNNDKVLVYSSNIGENSFILKEKLSKDGRKKQFIKQGEIKYKNCIIMPRTIGKKIKYFFIKDNTNKLFENHVIVITHNDISMLEKLNEFLVSGEVEKYKSLFFNSSNLSKEELLNMPFY